MTSTNDEGSSEPGSTNTEPRRADSETVNAASLTLSRDELTQNMAALDHGLEQIANRFDGHVWLAYEDPLTFGGGHFVLYPEAHSRSRFVIEEQYIDTDWSDPDRLPTSWTWASQSDRPRPEGGGYWHEHDSGEVPSQEVSRLIARATSWAQATRDVSARETAVGPAHLSDMETTTHALHPSSPPQSDLPRSVQR